eukprot:5331615-Pleurochrysis_carterae.AAC.1
MIPNVMRLQSTAQGLVELDSGRVGYIWTLTPGPRRTAVGSESFQPAKGAESVAVLGALSIRVDQAAITGA